MMRMLMERIILLIVLQKKLVTVLLDLMLETVRVMEVLYISDLNQHSLCAKEPIVQITGQCMIIKETMHLMK